MGVVFERHGWEAYTVVVADAIVEKETLDSDLEAIKGYFRSLRRDDIKFPVGVNEIEVALGQLNGRVDGCGQSNINRFLIWGLNQLNHGSFEEADEAASELRPNVTVKMDLDVLLWDHKLYIDCGDRWQHSSIKKLLGGESNADLKFETLEVDISMTLGLNKALFQLKVAAVEGSWQVIGLKNYRIVAHIIVEID